MSQQNQTKILVVDDDHALLKLISLRLKSSGYDIKCAESSEQALSILAQWQADLVVTDLQMSGMPGMALFQKLHQKNPLLPVIILTAHGSIPEAVEATQAGVFSYLTKPFESQVLLKHIKSALQASGNHLSTSQTHADVTSNTLQQASWRNNIITQNSEMKKLCQQIEKVAPTQLSVLIEGDSGTGKLLIAQSIHDASNREGNFVTVNCATIDDKFDDSLFKEAENGSLFFDEISDLSLTAQNKLLLTLQKHKTKPTESGYARIISATQTNLKKAITESTLRTDLLYRLNAVALHIPTLQERTEDILLIANNWLEQNQTDKNMRFSRKAMKLLTSAQWPGNIRQLRHVIEQCCILSTTNIISDNLVASVLRSPINQIQPLSLAHTDFERDYIINLLKLTKGNVTHAADLAKRNRTEFHRLLKKHQLEAKLFR